VSSGASARDLDRSLDRLLAGEHLSDGEASAPELSAAWRLRSLTRPGAEPAARSLARDLFLAEADGRRARWVHTHHVPAVAPVPRRKGIRLGQLTLLLAALMIAVTLGVILAIAADFSTPDSGLYPIKRAGESALLGLSRDPVGRSDLEGRCTTPAGAAPAGATWMRRTSRSCRWSASSARRVIRAGPSRQPPWRAIFKSTSSS
jgi:hypothetical protein